MIKRNTHALHSHLCIEQPEASSIQTVMGIRNPTAEEIKKERDTS